MWGVTEQTIRERVASLRAEVTEIARLNEEYLHISHPREVEEAHKERRKRLKEIVMELKPLLPAHETVHRNVQRVIDTFIGQVS